MVRAGASLVGRYAPLIVPDRARVAYVGAVDRTNMGDAALYLAHLRLFPGVRFAVLPAGGRNRGIRVLNALHRGTVAAAVILGGGTLIGRTAHRRRVDALLDNLPGAPAHAFGTGVEDPAFRGSRWRTDEAELARWGETLARFEEVTVRGPRSQQVLADAGVASRVIGDPALVFAGPTTPDQIQERRLGLNLGVMGELWGDDLAAVSDFVVAFGRAMVARGWRISVVPVSPVDVDYCRQAATGIGEGAEVFEDFSDLDALLDELGRCQVFVGEKLHSVVLASARAVPSVMLEYRPKCRDFQQSVGREEFTMRTDQLDLDTLVGMVDDLAEHRADHARAIEGEVSRLRGLLVDQATKVARGLAPGG